LARAGAILTGLLCTLWGYLVGRVYGPSAIKQHRQTASPYVTQESPSNASSQAVGTALFQPARVLNLELSQPLPDLAGFDPASNNTYRRALVLVRLHTRPLGVVELDLTHPLNASEIAHQIWQALGSAIRSYLQAEALPMVDGLTAAGLAGGDRPACVAESAWLGAATPLVSVVIATHNRTASLALTLDSLLALDYPAYEIILVDNAPSNTTTADLIQQRYGHLPQVRYVREERPGLAIAHNRGLQEVTGQIVAFTDDDVIVDRHWLTALVGGFALADDVACVTGMIAPAELETPTQGWIEQFGFSKGFQRRIFDLDQYRPATPLYPYAAGTFGSGANMAFRSAVLRQLGGFDPALGAGSLALGGDDLAAFFQVIVHGYKLVYEPAALVQHWHRREYAGLRRQAYGYGVGLTAFLTKTLLERPSRLWTLVRSARQGVRMVRQLRSPKHMPDAQGYPQELTTLERRGMLYGPVAYLRSRWRIRQWQLTSAAVTYTPRPIQQRS